MEQKMQSLIHVRWAAALKSVPATALLAGSDPSKRRTSAVSEVVLTGVERGPKQRSRYTRLGPVASGNVI
ncbi:hypothetical protein JCM17092_08930 [Haloplanus litoreus]